MAKKTKKTTTPAARNFLLEPKVKASGRGKNKVEAIVGAKKGRLQKRLFCLPIQQVGKKGGKHATKFECFADFEAAQKAFLSGAKFPGHGGKGAGHAVVDPAFAAAAALRAEIARMAEANPLPVPGFAGRSRRAVPSRGLAAGKQPDLSDRPAKKALREHIYTIPDDDDVSQKRWDATYERLKRAAEAEDDLSFRGLYGAGANDYDDAFKTDRWLAEATRHQTEEPLPGYGYTQKTRGKPARARALDNSFILPRWAERVNHLEEVLKSGKAAEQPNYPGEIGWHGDSYRDWVNHLINTGYGYAERYPAIRDTVERTAERLEDAYAEAQAAAGTEVSERDGRRYPKLQGGKKGLRGDE